MKKKYSSLKGKVLVARRDLLDPNFVSSIVFLAEHNEEGALGFILNRPVGVTLREAVSSSVSLPDFLGEVPVFIGGPVQIEGLSLVLFEPTPKGRKIVAIRGASEEEIRRKMETSSCWLRAFVGYSGWAPGQLEREIREGSWEIQRADPTMFDMRFVAGLWPFLIARDTKWRLFIDYIPRRPDFN